MRIWNYFFASDTDHLHLKYLWISRKVFTPITGFNRLNTSSAMPHFFGSALRCNDVCCQPFLKGTFEFQIRIRSKQFWCFAIFREILFRTSSWNSLNIQIKCFFHNFSWRVYWQPFVIAEFNINMRFSMKLKHQINQNVFNNSNDVQNSQIASRSRRLASQVSH